MGCQVDDNINLLNVFWVVGNVLLAGISPQFCDIENLAKISQKIEKNSWIYTKKVKNSLFFVK